MDVEWKVNEEKISNTSLILNRNYEREGKYKVFSKVIAYCDTCLSTIVACNSLDNNFEKIFADTASVISPETDISKVKGVLTSDQLTGIGFNVQPILFAFNSTELSEEAQNIIAQNQQVLKKYPNLKIEITGYTDTRGSIAYNKMLSEKRAGKVKQKILNGIDKKQIKVTAGKGLSEPAVECKDGLCDENIHAQNRRVIFKVYSN